ncbi:hypothetical protein E8E11_003432 [Didymella keratinophila]|nr:hypothetical protein E8E11_003432 [Didymella keratinophila]
MLRNIAILALGGLATALPQPATDVPAVVTKAPTGTEPGAAPTRVSPDPTGPTSHGPYSGSATATGNKPAGTATLALKFDGPAIPNPTATYYNPDGILRSSAQLPFTPGGGKGVNGTLPRYMVESDFDFESVNLGLHQEFIELDLFNNGLATFSDQDFIDAGLTAEDRAFIAFMATQEIDHATLLTNMLGEAAPKQCIYNYPFTTVREFIDFNVKLTRWGESGNWGFISHLDSREVATLLVQAESIEARQQMAFRQMLGLHPMPVSFTPGIPQSWHWTFLAPYISSCPANNTRIAWQNFPALHILNTPNPNRVSPNDTAENEVVGPRIADPSISNLTDTESCVHNTTTGYNCSPAISHNRTEPLTFPGRKIFLEWEDAGKAVGPNNSYVTSTSAGEPKFLAWVSQINTTYTPLEVTGLNQGWSWQPPNEVYQRNPAVNETVFVAVTDSDLYLTPFNLTLINPHVRALGIFVAG